MSKKRVFRLIFAWQEEKEEKWLNEMAQKGWLLDNYIIGLYTFVRSEPGDYIYKFDYIGGRNIDKYDYINTFHEAGWEHVTEYFGWHYFRTKADNAKYPDIYSDNWSRIQKYKDLLRILIIAAFANLLNLPFIIDMVVERDFKFDFIGILRIFIAVVLVILVYAIYRIYNVIKKLEDDL